MQQKDQWAKEPEDDTIRILELHEGSSGKAKHTKNRAKAEVTYAYVQVENPDAEARLCKAFEILFKEVIAARNSKPS